MDQKRLIRFFYHKLMIYFMEDDIQYDENDEIYEGKDVESYVYIE